VVDTLFTETTADGATDQVIWKWRPVNSSDGKSEEVAA
jgi:hypothetical protein